MGSVNNFLSGVSKGKTAVHDPWHHSDQLMASEAEIEFKKKNYGKLIGKRAMLSSIGDDTLMLYNQFDISLLTAAYELACREEEFIPVFEFMFHSWTGGLTLTRAMKSKERELQATPGGGYTPPQELQGFGQDLGYGQEEQGFQMPQIQLPKSKQPPNRI